MQLSESLILALAQGLTEFLPVSSSGHLALLTRLLSIPENPIGLTILLHVATALATIAILWHTLVRLIRDLLQRNAHAISFTGSLGIATAVTAFIGITFQKSIEAAFTSPALIGIGLLVTTGLLIAMPRNDLSTHRQNTEYYPTISWRSALLLGLLQSIAILPGISRSGATIFAGRSLGLTADQAFKTSFLLSLPTIVGAILLYLTDASDISLSANTFAAFNLAFFTGVAALLLVRNTLKMEKFHYFAFYTGILGIVILLTQAI